MQPGPWAGVLVAVAVGGAACSSAPAVPPGAPALAARPVAQPPALPVSGGATSLVLPATTLSEDQRILHALNRLAYGPRPGDVERVRRMGLAAYIDGQLDPRRIADPALEQALAAYPVLDRTAAALVHEYPLPTPQVRQKLAQGEMTRQDVAAMYPPERRPLVITTQMQAARITRAVLSERQLQEVMVDFWFNHFNVFAQQGRGALVVPAYERDGDPAPRARPLPRPAAGHRAPPGDAVLPRQLAQHAAGLRACARGPNQGRRGGLNENYARELMELHTLGVDGGYTQQDVTEVARALHRLDHRSPARAARFVFRPATHDYGAKRVLGRVIPAAASDDGEPVLDMLAAAPGHRALHRRQAGPPLRGRRSAARAGRARGGRFPGHRRRHPRHAARDLQPRRSSWPRTPPAPRSRSPLEFVASAVRALAARTPDARGATGAARPAAARSARALYEAQPPTGYPDRAEAWVNPGALLARMNFALALAQGRLPGVSVDVGALVRQRIGSSRRSCSSACWPR